MPWEGDTYITPAATEEKQPVDELALDRERRRSKTTATVHQSGK
jgi:hypothetical protein